jgi:hypothetical protein
MVDISRITSTIDNVTDVAGRFHEIKTEDEELASELRDQCDNLETAMGSLQDACSATESKLRNEERERSRLLAIVREQIVWARGNLDDRRRVEASLDKAISLLREIK